MAANARVYSPARARNILYVRVLLEIIIKKKKTRPSLRSLYEKITIEFIIIVVSHKEISRNTSYEWNFLCSVPAVWRRRRRACCVAAEEVGDKDLLLHKNVV